MNYEALLKYDEKAIFALRALYRQYGYKSFKMSKFEEYDLYVRNKDFLISDSVITFNDTNGRLMALKPDVTLSIIKNGVDAPGCLEKVYYNENVYRVSGSTHTYKEIMQAGLECVGDVSPSDIFEVVYLAAKSLATVSENFVLDVSHMGILSAILDEASSDEVFQKKLIRLISEKNRHGIEALCNEFAISSTTANKLLLLSDAYGTTEKVLPMLEKIAAEGKAKDALISLKNLLSLLAETEYADRIRIDFSVVNDMNYYNGILFKGFLAGICEGVLSGGEYGLLMRRMKRKSNAIGFALYLDLLSELATERDEYDVDVLLLYQDKTPTTDVVAAKNRIIKDGKSVIALKSMPNGLRFKELCKLEDGGAV